MAAAKQLKVNPRDLAQRVIDHNTLVDLADDVSLAGPGFINVRLNDEFLAKSLATEPVTEPTSHPKTIVVDYSSPNLAKELHVGHLRSTVIGDAMVRVLELAGHKVIRQNHVGDWGTTFGKLIAHLDEFDEDASRNHELRDLERLYVEATNRFTHDSAFAEKARQVVVKLNRQEPETLETWKKFIDVSLNHAQAIYKQLGVLLTPDDVRGESSYNHELPNIVEELERQELLVESEGAKVVFLEEFKGKNDELLPLIVQKSDSGYLYLTTDLAAARYRSNVLCADRILYLTDARQQLHFRMLFALARRAGFVSSVVDLEHHVFGSILNANGEPFSTREGDAIPLAQLLQSGIDAAAQIVENKSSNLPAEERRSIAHALAIGAIKHADLSKNRINDYRFDLATMLSFEGNTAPYLQYAHARIHTLFERGGIDPDELPQVQPRISETSEHNLAVCLLRFQETIEQVVAEVKPHYLCNYLYDLAGKFTRFYETCPVLNAPTDYRASRLALCTRTAQVLRSGLSALGIQAPIRM